MDQRPDRGAPHILHECGCPAHGVQSDPFPQPLARHDDLGSPEVLERCERAQRPPNDGVGTVGVQPGDRTPPGQLS